MTLQMGILLCLALLGLSTALVCPDGGMCEDKNTCCMNTEGGYGCCPLPHAECCSDHLHCCYEGTLCDLVHAKCVNKTVSLPWMRRVPSKQLIPQLNCCPEGTKCDLAQCVSASRRLFPMLQKLPARSTENNPAPALGSVTCPGGKSSCPDSFTCCLLTSGDYGCCPYPEAMCCSDRLHCCPSNTICDLEHGICKSGEADVPLLEKIAAAPRDVECADKKTSCPDQTTCCQMTNGTYGCCPMPDAVCCSDHIHCCPAGTQCDLVHSACVSTQPEPPRTTRGHAAVTEELVAQSKAGSVPCNDSVACADGNTCCKSPRGEWACCPLPEAVCCEDHLHCCPHNTICNLAASTCDDAAGSAVMPWLSKVPVSPSLSDNDKCDESTSCPRKSTCCKTAGGDWACCPLPQAVCCDDHLHCCPHGTVCNLEAQSCDDPSGFLPSRSWVEKVQKGQKVTSQVQEERCDQQTRCPGGTTCCKKNSGQWACCPFPQAVCCSDREHCCPEGYECNVSEQTCDQPGGLGLPWLQKTPALREEPARAVSSPTRNMCDAQTSCPRDTTCCFMDRTHQWGCCPLPKAVCCKDGNHCCPAGHTCDPHRSSCSKGPRVVPWFTKLSARTEPGALADVKCDDKSSCASGTTCCKLQTGEWGCCPLVKAVCCADREHCCPQGYTCNMQTSTCEKTTRALPHSQVVRAEGGEDVPCDGTGGFRCPKQHTCCKVSAAEWACCPSPRAVCCSDSRHCCPAGYSCNLQAGGCSLRSRLTWDTLFGDRKKDFVLRGL